MSTFTESTVEEAALAWLESTGWQVAHGPDIAPDMPAAERRDYGEVVLAQRLRDALARLNPQLPAEALEDAFRKLTRPEGTDLIFRNSALHRLLVDGVTVEYRDAEGGIRGAQARVIDFDDPAGNDWMAVNQFSVVENKHSRRPDVVLFVNGLPLAVVELKNAADEDATIWSAFQQLQTYKAEIPALFATNELLVVSDGVEARGGTLTAGREWFKPWRTISGAALADAHIPELQVVTQGLLASRRFLDLIRDFIVFEDDGGGRVVKKMAGYHQFHAVQVAVRETLRAAQLRDARKLAAGRKTGVTPFRPRVVRPAPEERYSNCVPLVPLQAAAGTFGDPKHIPEDDLEWVAIETRHRLRPGMFVAEVVGRSMEPSIPDGAWCLFSAPVEGTRQGKTVLVQLRDEVDPETGQRYTVKRYESEKAAAGDSWRHTRITLKPLNPDFDPIVLAAADEGRLQVVAEVVEVLGTSDAESSTAGDRRVGVVWHTQGSGKSLTMTFYAGRIIREPAMENPTLVVLTDRNDLDDQLFGTFSRCAELLRQPPVQAESRAHLRELLSVAAGGVVFTTIHKFFPEEKGDRHPILSERRNVVVIADEAHRSQYDFIDGYARHMRDALPHASFIGFTGTPIELQDANTRAVFGDYISVYDIQRAVQDGATVPIYYESRLAKLALDEAERPKIDPDFEEATEGEEVERKEKLKTRWAHLEAVVGAEKRLGIVARDIVEHFEKRLEAMDGKAMIVCMSRRICVELYREIVKMRPEWASEADDQGTIKVVMTGSASDPPDWQEHIRNKPRREALASRFRDAADPLRLVLVRDMWLTGFDAPSLHTMYVDKPMRGHGLMQAIARVNRVFKDKPGGLVVDYLGLAHELKAALAAYTESGGIGRTALNQDEAVAVMLEKYEVCCGLFHGFDRSKWTTGTSQERLGLLPPAQEHILAQDNGKDRCVRAVRELSQAFALAVPHLQALRIRDAVAFFQAVQAVLVKRAPGDARPEEELDHAVRQIISRAVAPERVVDIFAAAGLAKPDISILSDEFLAEVRGMPQRNLAVELLQKLLKGELAMRRRKNIVQARSFAEMLEQTIRRYQNRAIEAAQVIEELIDLAKQMREANARGETLGLSEDELAFYDALETNDSAVKVLGDETLRGIARELVETVRNNVTIDWTLRENVRAQLRVLVKRILRKHGYPPDKQEKATQTVLEQAALLSAEWAAA
ncbi:MAG TPA: HsdR family type I site-specific deoxyribonuclease [Planctomycetota bacterium]|jgi:type I restriction enzyme R subunit|nr:HsdR family type I site-specific deoxyribonuclease [Planctomycetota bacterium]